MSGRVYAKTASPSVSFSAPRWPSRITTRASPRIDAQHYTFRITLTDASDEVGGEATVDLRFLQSGVTQVVLDLTSLKDGKGMTVAAVSSRGAALKFQHSADRLAITLDSTPAPGERRQFTVKYHGIAGTGLHIAKNKFGDRTFFSWNWPTLARQWLPMIDHPYDKATSEFLVTAPAKYQVVANGLLQEELDLGDGRRMTHWKESVPIASWLNNIGVAQFATRHFGTAAGVPLQTWVFPQDRDNGILTFEEPTRQAIEFFTSHIGPYPYEKLADVQVAGMGGGMEHASAIFFGERSVTNRPAFGLVAHEISHQWFGDSVTEKDWDDAWLSEGFATYFASLASEFYQGRDAFLAAMRRSRTGILGMEKRTPGVAVVHDNLPEIQNGRAPVPHRLSEGRLDSAHAPRRHRHGEILGRNPRILPAISRFQRFHRRSAARHGRNLRHRPRLVLPAVAASPRLAHRFRRMEIQRRRKED